MPVQTQYFPLSGGTDLVTSYLQIQPGRTRSSRNYECLIDNGYRRVGGYTLYDGAETPAAVPGSGPVRGVWILNGEVYAIRDNAGATAAVLFKSSAGGWVAQDLGSTLEFDTGGIQAQIGDTITGLTSGATGIVRRLTHTGGGYSNTDRTGSYTLYSVSGTFVNGEELQVLGTTYSHAVGTATANTLPVGGKYTFDNNNFYGPGSTERMYAAGGVGPAWEYDGTYFAFCQTKLDPADDIPKFVAAHKDHLALGYEAGSVLVSSLGEPLEFEALGGSIEIAVGDFITGLHPLSGGVLAIFQQDKIDMLYGNNAQNFQQQLWSNTGAYPYSMDFIGGNVLYLDALGVQNIQTSQQFSDFASVTVSRFIREDALLKQAPETVTAVTHWRGKDSYRMFFGKRAWFFTFSGPELVGAMSVEYEHDVNVACSGDRADNTEWGFFGDSNGNVFEMESDVSFNGTPIEAFMQLPFNHIGRPTTRKRWRKMSLDIRADGQGVQLFILPVYDQGSSQSAQNRIITVSTGGGGLWNFDNWNEFNWDSPELSSANVKLVGHGDNMSAYIYANGYDQGNNLGGEHTIYGVVLHFSTRRLQY